MPKCKKRIKKKKKEIVKRIHFSNASVNDEEQNRQEQMQELQAMHSIYYPVTVLQIGSLNLDDLPDDIQREKASTLIGEQLYSSSFRLFFSALDQYTKEEISKFLRYRFKVSSITSETHALIDVTVTPKYPSQPPALVVYVNDVLPPELIQTLKSQIREICRHTEGICMYEISLKVVDYLDQFTEKNFTNLWEEMQFYKQKKDEGTESDNMETILSLDGYNEMDNCHFSLCAENIRKRQRFQAAVNARIGNGNGSDEDLTETEDGKQSFYFSENATIDTTLPLCASNEVIHILDDMQHYKSSEIEIDIQGPFWKNGDYGGDSDENPYWSRLPFIEPALSPVSHLRSVKARSAEKIESIRVSSESFSSLPVNHVADGDYEEIDNKEIYARALKWQSRYCLDFFELQNFDNNKSKLRRTALVQHKIDMNKYIVKIYRLIPQCVWNEKKICTGCGASYTPTGVTEVNPQLKNSKAETDQQLILQSVPCPVSLSKQRAQIRLLIREVSVISRMQHMYIIRYHQSWYERDIFNSEDLHPDLDFRDFSGGVSDEFNNSLSPSSTSNLGKALPGRSVYVQMEYCSGKTLRELIDKGTIFRSPRITWTLFRQIIDALVYLHRNNTFHRALHPCNIFVEKDDFGTSIKLSNFGLGHLIGITDELEDIYLAPELKEDPEFNEKTDVFALGILFYEMWHEPFANNQERYRMLNEAKLLHHQDSASKVIPAEVYTIFQQLCDPDPNVRPSALKLLQNPSIPLTADKETLKQLVNRVKKPLSSESLQVISLLMGRHFDDASGSAYFNSIRSQHWNGMLIQSRILSYLEDYFTLQGALEIDIPVVLPSVYWSRNDENDTLVNRRTHSISRKMRHRQLLVDSANTALFLPVCLIYSFARTATHYLNDSDMIKRFSLSNTYSTPNTESWGSGYGCPQERLNAMFDVVLNPNKIFSDRCWDEEGNHSLLTVLEADVICAAIGAMEPFRQICGTPRLRWTHAGLLSTLLKAYFAYSESTLESLEKLLRSGNYSFNSIKRIIQGEFKTSSSTVNAQARKILTLCKPHLSTPAKIAQIQNLILKLGQDNNDVEKINVDKYLKHVRYMDELLHSVNLNCHLSFELALDYDSSVFNKSIVFDISLDPFISDAICSGGHYSKLIPEHLHQGTYRGIVAFGFEVDIQSVVDQILVMSLDSLKLNNLGIITPHAQSPEVVVSTQSIKIHNHAFSLTHKLLLKGIMAELRINPVVDTLQFTRYIRQSSTIRCHVQIQRASRPSTSAHQPSTLTLSPSIYSPTHGNIISGIGSEQTTQDPIIYHLELISFNDVQKKKFDSENAVLHFLQATLIRSKAKNG